MRFAEFSFLLPFRLLTFSCRKKEIVYEKEVFVTIINFFEGGVIFLLALLTSCPGSSDIKIHTVTFDLRYDGAPPPEKIEIEDGAVLPSVEHPVRDGYQFDGWYTADGTLYEFNTPVTESFTLTARWKIKSSGGGGGGGSSAPSEEESLKGQWAFYYSESSDNFYLIDIQHTLQGYWIFMYYEDGNLENATLPVKSDRKGPDKDGWFEVTDHSDPDSATKIRYKFADNDRNTLEAEVSINEEHTENCKLERISSENEIKLHIVTFQLDESIPPDDGYVFRGGDIQDLSSPLLIAVKHGTYLGDYFPSLVQKDGISVDGITIDDAQFKTDDDGTVFTETTPVNRNITVIVVRVGL